MSIGISHWDFWSWLLCWLSQKNLTNTESNLHISLFTPMLFFPVIMRNCAFSYLMPILPLDFSFCFLRNPNNQGSLTFLASSLLDSSHHFKHDQFSWRYGKLWTERENFKGTQRKRTYHIQKNQDKNDSRLLLRNYAGHNTVEWYL